MSSRRKLGLRRKKDSKRVIRCRKLCIKRNLKDDPKHRIFIVHWGLIGNECYETVNKYVFKNGKVIEWIDKH